jgi:hypothetical protein
VPEAAGDATPFAVATWRSIDELAALVGAYSWLEHRLFVLTGGWAARRGNGDVPDPIAAEYRVWCAAASRRHGSLAGRWAERLPLRAGIDAAALVTPPEESLVAAFDELAASDVQPGFGVLVEIVLPWVGGLYAFHLERANPASEAPVMEVLVEARRAVEGETWAGQSLLQRLPGDVKPSRHLGEVAKRAFATAGIFPAVRPS